MAILTVKDKNGNKINIPAINGKSAYQYALDGGYTASESEFIDKLSKEWATKDEVSQLEDTIPTVPTSLKNPYKLTISLGDSSYTYDGSEAVSIAIEDGSEVIY